MSKTTKTGLIMFIFALAIPGDAGIKSAIAGIGMILFIFWDDLGGWYGRHSNKQ